MPEGIISNQHIRRRNINTHTHIYIYIYISYMYICACICRHIIYTHILGSLGKKTC